MDVKDFVEVLKAEFYTGVPDSLLKPLSSYLMNKYGLDSKHHIIAANEGNACGLAAGYHLASGKVPVVYMQNSGEGNCINPLASLLNDKVYGIPVIFVIGWRGEPGVHDEPQHIYQGEVTIKLLEDMNIKSFVVSKETSSDDLTKIMAEFNKELTQGKQVAFVIKKGALEYDGKVNYQNDYLISREEAIKHIVAVSKDDLIISTTGKASRELFEARVELNENHDKDFLTVGSMGHSSSIALGVAVNTDKKVWCIDGDGALLMHMGSLATIGNYNPSNLIHILINNTAHESVGGMPTVINNINVCEVVKACGYKNVYSVDNIQTLDEVLMKVKDLKELSFVEIKCCISARADLGRPTTTAKENKENFMKYIGGN